MSETGKQPRVGSIGWLDLTVDDAETVRDFYRDVVGWKPSPVSMGDYDDFNMIPPGGEPAAGVCHARGTNAELPPVWLVYLIVADLDGSLETVRERGGAIVTGPKGSREQGRFAVIRDPAGAHCALYQPGA